MVESHGSPARRSGSTVRHDGGISRSHSTSPLRRSPVATVTSSSSADVDPVSVQMALRSFSKQFIAAEKDRVSNIHAFGDYILLKF